MLNEPYCDGGRKDDHIRIRMLWKYPYWYCDVCGRKIYNGKLKQWSRLDAERLRLEAKVANLEEYINTLRQSLSTYRSPMISDMPGTPLESRISDSVGDYVANLEEKVVRAQLQLADIKIRLQEVIMGLDEIERMVIELGPKHQKIVTMIYRDRVSWESICSTLHLEKSEVYRKRDKAIESIEGGVWQK